MLSLKPIFFNSVTQNCEPTCRPLKAILAESAKTKMRLASVSKQVTSLRTEDTLRGYIPSMLNPFWIVFFIDDLLSDVTFTSYQPGVFGVILWPWPCTGHWPAEMQNVTAQTLLCPTYRNVFKQLFLPFYQGLARTQTPTTKNYAPELPTFGVIAGVNQTEVQW